MTQRFSRKVVGMPFAAETYRVLIASPSDLAEERRCAVAAITEWNAQHAAAEGAVLLPVMRETHATPQAGIRPQEAINRTLVADSDILIGLFWTKLGTSTGMAASDIVEEINQFVAAEKPALLYFSYRPTPRATAIQRLYHRPCPSDRSRRFARTLSDESDLTI